jgi:hypothetical protein
MVTHLLFDPLRLKLDKKRRKHIHICALILNKEG